MQSLTLFMIVAVTTFEFLATGDKWGRWALLPGWFRYLPEILGAMAAVIVVFAGAASRFRFVRPAYFIVFGALLFTIVGGIAINGVEAGPIFAGIRNYLRAIPWFLVAAVVAFNDEQVRTQLRLLVSIALLQLPLAVQQSLTALDAGKVTGDWTIGSLMSSSTLTIFLVCCMCVAAAFFVRRRLRLWQFGVLFLLLTIPTMINETKVTIFLVPIGLLTAVLTAANTNQRVRYATAGLGFVMLFTAVFIPSYDAFIEEREYSVPLVEFLTDEQRLLSYMSSTDDVGIGDQRAGRLDSIIVPLRRLSFDPVRLFFGYGIGNVSDSALGAGFVGQHSRLFGPFLGTSFSRLVLEFGLLGVAGVLTVLWMVFRDARLIARKCDGLIGAFAAGWVGVVAVVTVCHLYSDIILSPALSFLFWFLSGLIAGARMRILSASDSFGRFVTKPSGVGLACTG